MVNDPLNNWDRFDGDSEESEWDLTEECDLVDYDSCKDKDDN